MDPVPTPAAVWRQVIGVVRLQLPLAAASDPSEHSTQLSPVINDQSSNGVILSLTMVNVRTLIDPLSTSAL
jgi:hypothetical protein